jgi:GNAT superfamily N-acetyltransferase
MIVVREAIPSDTAAIRQIFLACYGADYSPQYYDEFQLTRLVYSDNSLLLVAEDTETGKVLATASVDLEVGARSDLVGEFGRLAVLPAARGRGIGRLLMAERLRRVADRIQVGLAETRIAHPYSIKIAEAQGFAPVGFLPMRWRMRERESLVLLARHFGHNPLAGVRGHALEMRKNHPRVIPEIHALAHMALENCGLTPDIIVDEDAPPYRAGGNFEFEELATEGYSSLLRIERGRVRHREIFGPMRLHYGMFKMQSKGSSYLIARQEGRVVGAVGFTIDARDRSARIIELISLDDEVIRTLLSDLDRTLTGKLAGPAEVVEVDVSAYAPRMQRTLLELGFLPVAYVPALAFDDVERLDVVKMFRLPAAPQVNTEHLTPRARALADLVLRRFRSRSVLPRVAAVVHRLPLFAGLEPEQVARLAGVCGAAVFEPGQALFHEGEADYRMHVVLEGEVGISVAGSADPVGVVRSGECLGEGSLLAGSAHSATATARTRVETAVLEHSDIAELIRQRPDIGLHIYKNLASGAVEKLKRLDQSLAHSH